MNRNLIKKILYFLLFFIGFIFVIGAVIGIIFYFEVGYGGFWGFISEQRKMPKDDKLEILRNEAIMHLTQAHSRFSALEGLTFYEKTYSDKCTDGEHSWKRSDSFAYLCSYRSTYYYGIDEGYIDILLDLENKLDEYGWKLVNSNPEQITISESIRHHTGDIFTVDMPLYVARASKGYEKNMKLRINNFPGYYSGWMGLSKEPDPFYSGVASYQIFHEDTSNIQPDSIFERIEADGKERLFISITVDYFRN